MEILYVLIGAALSGAGVFVVLKYVLNWVNVKDIPEEVILRTVNAKASEKLSQSQEEALKIKEEAENRLRQIRREIAEQEGLLVEREKKINERSKMVDIKNDELEKEMENLKNMQRGLESSRVKLKEELEKISGLTRDEAKKKLMEEIEVDIKEYQANLIRKSVKEAEEQSDQQAKEILVDVMHRVATDYVGESTTSSVKVDDEKVKGRIIGKEGRNIRAFEKMTGVDVIVDESPTSIGLSSFDTLRREIARVALTKLMSDGRIHPGSIEEVIRKAKNEVAIEIKKNGEILAEEADWLGMDLGLLKLIGKMKYRTSYGQSLMAHTIEMMRIGATLAAELRADVALVKKACLLHDVGKVLTHKIDIPHHHISGQIARKYGLDEKLVNAIESHHGDIEPRSVEAHIVAIADAISGARPGARKDSYEQYIKRMEGIENAAREIAGDKIEEVYAIRAGREVRVLINPKNSTDEEATVMAKKIAENIEKTQNYPGNIEISVIREFRAVELAR